MHSRQTEADFYFCKQIIRSRSKSFYYAFSKLPFEKANAVYAIYAFCRIADDCADGNHSQLRKQQLLKQLKRELDLFEKQNEIDKPLWRALRQVFDDYDMEIQPFFDQLTGQAMDADFTMPQTMHELEQYSYYVAGSVGLMLLPVIASKNAADLRAAAIDLGTAMQLTNILRDVGEDFHQKQRIYLPQDELDYFHYAQQELQSGAVTKQFISLWEKLAVRAEHLYDSFLHNISQFDPDSRIPVSLSVQVYRGILDAVRNNGYDCLSKRNYVSKDRMKEISTTISSYS
ncbi:dehydrosqualene synthase [Lentibacillus kapialis]|uniref:Dehydrosqualene synthase n=1 Tax=Lentibacillus kapialis TaxID=340214 RepID=A0A917PMG2_9BACI|nr:phytoene/squalene synthase family protein [Lentibacillus kapialis]GGJ84718.1 dehydrosqualene synthase [Lentibacillus kapialis]